MSSMYAPPMMPVASTDRVSRYDPEGQREPEEARRDVRDRGVDEHLDEGAHAVRRRHDLVRLGCSSSGAAGGRRRARLIVGGGHAERVPRGPDIRNPWLAGRGHSRRRSALAVGWKDVTPLHDPTCAVSPPTTTPASTPRCSPRSPRRTTVTRSRTARTTTPRACRRSSSRTSVRVSRRSGVQRHGCECCGTAVDAPPLGRGDRGIHRPHQCGRRRCARAGRAASSC